MRAVAALLVVVQHATYFAATLKGQDYLQYELIPFGGLGVLMFFVISGYVMGGCLHQGPRFLLNRVIRIYPPFWIAIMASVFVRPLGDVWFVDWRSLSLVPTTILNESYAIPYWTLCYEVAFYVAVYAMILAGLRRSMVLAVSVAWAAATVVAGALKPPAAIAAPGLWIWLSPVSLGFIVGLIVYVLPSAWRDRTPAAVLIAAAVVLWYVPLPGGIWHLSLYYLATSASFACVLLTVRRWPVPGVVERLGDASYGLYLAHFLIIKWVVRVVAPFAPRYSYWQIWTQLMVAAIVLGTAYGWFEFRVHARLKGLLAQRRAPSPVPVGLAPASPAAGQPADLP